MTRPKGPCEDPWRLPKSSFSWDLGFLQPDAKEHSFLDEAALQGFIVTVESFSVFSFAMAISHSV